MIYVGEFLTANLFREIKTFHDRALDYTLSSHDGEAMPHLDPSFAVLGLLQSIF